jgi:type I restriction enzyme R subunit
MTKARSKPSTRHNPSPDMIRNFQAKLSNLCSFDQSLQSILGSRTWTTPQREWLKKLAAQTKANLLVDRAALDDPDLIFKRDGGGFPRLNKIFGGHLEEILGEFNEAVWRQA